MQTPYNLLPIESSPPAEIHQKVLVPSSPSLWNRAVGVCAVLTLLAGCSSSQDETYNTSNLAAAPHGATVDLPRGTDVAYEEFETGECSKSEALAPHVGALMVAPTTSKPPSPKTSKPPKPTKPSRISVPRCEGAEVQVEACQDGAKPDTNPETTASNCAHIDLKPQAFVTVTGLNEVEKNQVVTIKAKITGTIDKD